jgi:NADH dehydrogenase
MDFASVCIVGGSGFVGRALAEQLAPSGIGVRVVTRNRARAMALAVLPTTELVVADPHDTGALARCFENMDAVVNLVGILHEGAGQTFRACHVDLPAKVIEACHSAGVQHLVHMSALGAAADAPSAYLRSKAAGEAAVRASSGIMPFTIFRPSVMFGEGDLFIGRLAALARLLPVIPLAAADAKLQPIWVEDVARAMASTLGDARHFGRTYELCGTRAYTLAALLRFVAATLGRRPAIVPLPGPLASLQAFVLEHLPGKLLTRDNLRSLRVDGTCERSFPEIFGFEPVPLEAVVHEYLVGSSARARYARYRHDAGR